MNQLIPRVKNVPLHRKRITQNFKYRKRKAKLISVTKQLLKQHSSQFGETVAIKDSDNLFSY